MSEVSPAAQALIDMQCDFEAMRHRSERLKAQAKFEAVIHKIEPETRTQAQINANIVRSALMMQGRTSRSVSREYGCSAPLVTQVLNGVRGHRRGSVANAIRKEFQDLIKNTGRAA